MSSAYQIAMKDMGYLIELANVNQKYIPGPVFNVKGFGAKGDGVANDTDSLQKALDAAHVLGGGTVSFPDGVYKINSALYIYSNISLVGYSNSKIIGSHAGALFKKNATDTSINQVQFLDLILSTTNDDGILIDMDGVSNSVIRNMDFANSFAAIERKNKTGIRFKNVSYYNNVENCFFGGLNQGIIFEAVTDTGANENNVTGNNIRYCNTGVKITSLSNRETNAIRVNDNTLENNVLAVECDGKYCVFMDNRYENSTQAIKFGTLSKYNRVEGGIFYGTTVPYEDLGTDNRISVQLDTRAPIPTKSYGSTLNYLLNPDFNNIVSNVPEYWTISGSATAAIDITFVPGVRTLKLTIPASTSGVINLSQAMAATLRPMMVGMKYLKALIYNNSSEISNIRVNWNASTGLIQSGAHPGGGWSEIEAAGSVASTPTFVDVSLRLTAATTAERVIYIAFIGLTDHYIGDIRASWFAPYINRYGDTMQGDINLKGNKLKNAAIDSGLTANRPTSPVISQSFYDTTLGKPIWWNGSAWKDAAGTTV